LFSDTLTSVNSDARIPFVSVSLLNSGMTIDDIRRNNLKALVVEAGGVGKLAARIPRDTSQVSQWLNASKDSKSGKRRNISTDSARKIEHAMGKPVGWMDAPNPTAQSVAPMHEVRDTEAPSYGTPPSPGQRFDNLSTDEQRFVENLREIAADDEQYQELLDIVASRAAKIRAMKERWLSQAGVTATPARHFADARKTDVARAALDYTDTLRQRSLFEPRK
jgi:hypothetical protein